MLDVRAFGAVGDGVHDDTRAIQKALDADCERRTGKVLYFSAGTYRTTQTLYYNHRRAGCQKFVAGGWIAGAGSARSVIARDPKSPGSVFASEGLAYFDIQGLSFRTAPFRDGESWRNLASNFALENAPGVGNASQSVTFHDVVFDGGYSALGIGLEPESSGNCSENLMIHSVFRNAHHGLGVGHYNALANTVYSGSFENNAVTMGHVEGKASGGTWAVLGAQVRGTREQEMRFINSAGGAWYFYGLDSDTRRMLAPRNPGAIFPMVFDSSQLRPEALPVDGISFDFASAGGVTFLDSLVSRIGIRFAKLITTSYAFKLYSEIPGWKDAKRGIISPLTGELPLPGSRPLVGQDAPANGRETP